MSGLLEFGGVRTSTTVHQTSNLFAILFLPLLCSFGLLGNILVCMAIWRERPLHNVTNYFLFSLAFADLLVCALVMPLTLIVEFRNGVWAWSFSMCLLYVYADVLLCSASIVHISVISLDRYLGISKPLKLRNKSKTMIMLKIIFVWAVTVIISSPIAVAAVIEPSNIYHDHSCTITNQYYMIYGSTFAFLIPLLIMMVTYVRTTALLKQQATMIGHNPKNPHSLALRRSVTQRKCSPHNIPNGMSNGLGVTSSFRSAPILVCTDTELQVSNNPSEDAMPDKSRIAEIRARTAAAIFALASKISKKNAIQDTTSAELASENKATRVLAIVFACFFICWTPFFAANFAVGFCGSSCAVPPRLASFFQWLGYFSSTVNPLIYTIFNRQFRRAFLRILRCQCTHPSRPTPSRNHSRRTDHEFHTASEWTVTKREGDSHSAVTRWRDTHRHSKASEQFPILGETRSALSIPATVNSPRTKHIETPTFLSKATSETLDDRPSDYRRHDSYTSETKLKTMKNSKMNRCSSGSAAPYSRRSKDDSCNAQKMLFLSDLTDRSFQETYL